MSWPPEIETFTVTFGPAFSLSLGAELDIKVRFVPSVSVYWAATGTPLIAMVESVTAEAGSQGSADLVNPDQDGFVDGHGHAVKNWTYRADVAYTLGEVPVDSAKTVFTASAGDTSVDLGSLIPVTGSSGVTVAIPDSWTPRVAAAEAAASDAAGSAAAAVSASGAAVAAAADAKATADAALPAADLDAASTALLADPTSQFATLQKETIVAEVAPVSASIQKAARHDGVYIPSPLAALRLRQIKTRVTAGDRQGHIAWLGDSIPFGAASTGASSPKYLHAYPGRVRSILNKRYGSAGGGLTFCNDSVLTNGAWDPRWSFTGTVTNQGFGPFSKSCYRVAQSASGTNYVTFTDVCDSFVVYTVPAGGAGSLVSAYVDGVLVGTLTNNSAGSGGTIARRTGYFGPQNSSAHQVFDIPAGTSGNHTLKLVAGTAADAFIIAVEPILSGSAKWRVGNMSVSSQSLYSFGADLVHNESTSGLYGMAWIDTLRADVLVMALGINDWQGQRDIETLLKPMLRNVITRQRATGTSAEGSGTAPGGDILLVWNPQPDINTLVPAPIVTWDAYRQAFYDIADEMDVVLLDLGDRWTDYATGNSLGLFSDTIHPNDSGYDDLAAGIVHGLLDVI